MTRHARYFRRSGAQAPVASAVVVDPSHAAEYNLSAAFKGVDIGRGGRLMIEVHNNPSAALSDGAQSLTRPV